MLKCKEFSEIWSNQSLKKRRDIGKEEDKLSLLAEVMIL